MKKLRDTNDGSYYNIAMWHFFIARTLLNSTSLLTFFITYTPVAMTAVLKYLDLTAYLE